MNWKLWTEHVLRWGLGIIFLWAALTPNAPTTSKIWDPAAFAEEVSYYHMLPMWGVNWMAIFLPWLELVCAVALLTGIGRRGANVLVILMLVVFTYAIGHAVHEGRDISCGCFGHGEAAEHVGYVAIGRDALMLAAAAGVWVLNKSKVAKV